jgi:hypothetical protein
MLNMKSLFARKSAPARNVAPETKSVSAPLIALQLAGKPVWTPRDYAALAGKA